MNRSTRPPIPGLVVSQFPATFSDPKPFERSQAATSDGLTDPSSGTLQTERPRDSAAPSVARQPGKSSDPDRIVTGASLTFRRVRPG